MLSLNNSLQKTKNIFTFLIQKTLNLRPQIDKELFEQIEEILIKADIGVETSLKIITSLQEKIKQKHVSSSSAIFSFLKEEILFILGNKIYPIVQNSFTIILIIGVNGVGKTSVVAKLGHKFQQEGKKVLFAAADTFRAAAISQLEIWAKKINIDLIKHKKGADPSAVVFDAISSAYAKKKDILIIDTAGRFHTKKNLTEELKKIKKVIEKKSQGAALETLLVLDATTGQNALEQARIFQEAINISGIIVTKLDSSSKGGIIIAIKDKLKIPVKLITTGEKKEDLQLFEPFSFVETLFEI